MFKKQVYYSDLKRDLIFNRWERGGTLRRFLLEEEVGKRIREDAARTLCITCARV